MGLCWGGKIRNRGASWFGGRKGGERGKAMTPLLGRERGGKRTKTRRGRKLPHMPSSSRKEEGRKAFSSSLRPATEEKKKKKLRGKEGKGV